MTQICMYILVAILVVFPSLDIDLVILSPVSPTATLGEAGCTSYTVTISDPLGLLSWHLGESQL